MPKALEGREHDRGIIPASCYRGLGALPQSFFFILSPSICVLMGVLCVRD